MLSQPKLRALAALEAREAGLTFRQIALEFGNVSTGRAQQLVQYGRRIRKAQQLDPWNELSTMVQNALRNGGIAEPSIEGVLARYKSVEDLRRIDNLGKTSVAQIQAWLLRHGKESLPEETPNPPILEPIGWLYEV